MIASKIIELVKAGERNVEVLSEAALDLREQSGSPILHVSLHRRASRILHFEANRASAHERHQQSPANQRHKVRGY